MYIHTYMCIYVNASTDQGSVRETNEDQASWSRMLVCSHSLLLLY